MEQQREAKAKAEKGDTKPKGQKTLLTQEEQEKADLMKKLRAAYHYNEDQLVVDVKRIYILSQTKKAPAVDINPCSALQTAASEVAGNLDSRDTWRCR